MLNFQLPVKRCCAFYFKTFLTIKIVNSGIAPVTEAVLYSGAKDIATYKMHIYIQIAVIKGAVWLNFEPKFFMRIDWPTI